MYFPLQSKLKFVILSLSIWIIPFWVFSQKKLHFKDLENNKYKSVKKSINIFVFLDTECPISQQYVQNLETLRLAFNRKNIRFWAVFPTKWVTKEDIVAFQKKI